jgi:hypothetical protein
MRGTLVADTEYSERFALFIALIGEIPGDKPSNTFLDGRLRRVAGISNKNLEICRRVGHVTGCAPGLRVAAGMLRLVPRTRMSHSRSESRNRRLRDRRNPKLILPVV